MARDLIAIMEDVPADSFRLDMQITLPDDVRKDLELSADLRTQAAASQRAAAELTRGAARRLHEDGLTLRDIGKLLEVSHQRAHQLVDGDTSAADLRKLLGMLQETAILLDASHTRALQLVEETEDRIAV
jgi:predicted XRE-type DNA-binding protein